MVYIFIILYFSLSFLDPTIWKKLFENSNFTVSMIDAIM